MWYRGHADDLTGINYGEALCLHCQWGFTYGSLTPDPTTHQRVMYSHLKGCIGPLIARWTPNKEEAALYLMYKANAEGGLNGEAAIYCLMYKGMQTGD